MAFGKYAQSFFLGSRILCSPLDAMFTLLIFILSKDLNASLMQLTVMACLKPVVSLFAFYFNAFLMKNPQQRRQNLILANIVGCLPCLLFPFIQNPWFFVASYALFTTANRATYPVWSEILKVYLGLNKIGNAISKGTSIHYFMIMVLPLIFAYWMDADAHIWKMIFFGLGLLQLSNSLLLLYVPIQTCSLQASETTSRPSILSPWKDAKQLLSANNAFLNYLILFFLGGAGLIALQPILPHFFKNDLGLSYTHLAGAFSFCKGFSFIGTSPLWTKWFKDISIYRLNFYVNVFSCLFITLLLISTQNTYWLFLAYLMYGTMQAGCELSWNISGPLFSQSNDSIAYSNLNLALVGIRGCIFPVLGQILFLYTDAAGVFIGAGAVCLVSVIYAWQLDRGVKGVRITQSVEGAFNGNA